ncbi:hypothetical protein BON30_43995 [Cystobacter ferrugineus]|uniref:Uncharacterized protein n=1 Tax=Cystobacter ferrugineus TaxID=83449 RepID=A0A1L9AW89_9BACT|nr:hypothetical protein BON30_43995 [Cystobacter ferrugineus]
MIVFRCAVASCFCALFGNSCWVTLGGSGGGGVRPVGAGADVEGAGDAVRVGGGAAGPVGVGAGDAVGDGGREVVGPGNAVRTGAGDGGRDEIGAT